MMVPSSAALQNMNGTLGATASRLTRPMWQEKTWEFSSLFVSYTRILQSAAPVTRIESLVLGKNYRIWQYDWIHLFLNKEPWRSNRKIVHRQINNKQNKWHRRKTVVWLKVDKYTLTHTCTFMNYLSINTVIYNTRGKEKNKHLHTWTFM